MAGRPPPTELEMYEATDWLNSQPDAITAIVKNRTSIKGHLGDIYMTRLGEHGDHIEIKYWPPPGKVEMDLKLPLNPPIIDTFDLRPRLAGYRDQAFHRFGVLKIPVVDYFRRPAMFPFTVPAALALSMLLFALYGWGENADWFRERIVHYLGTMIMPASKWFAALMHFVVEPAYMIYMTRRHKTPIVPTIKWLLWTAAFGFSALNEFHECIMHERLRQVYKNCPDVGDIGPHVRGTKAPAVPKEKKDL